MSATPAGNARCTEQVWFDSATEREIANLIDDTRGIDVWAHLHLRDLEMRYDGGTYNP